MIDRISSVLLGIINAESADGAYKVLDAEELTRRMPKKYGVSREALSKTMEYLAEEELVTLKYADEKTFCVSSTPRGRLYNEKKTEEQKAGGKQKKLMIATLITSAMGGFIGALAALLIMLPIIG